MRSVRPVPALVAAATVTLLAVTATPASAVPTPPRIVVTEGGTQPVFDYAQAIRERLWVETSVDSDSDGQPDRVEVRVIRPAGTGQGLKVPVIFQPSPYYAGLNDIPNHDDVDRDDPGLAYRAPSTVDRAETIVFGGYLDNYFVPRGYAVVFADSLGTGGSTGCPTSGGENETQGMKAVVDWVNGRARGFDATGAEAPADWSTGKVGMIGVSYNGTLPNAVAATGVEGLTTIVPIAGISSWYDYYRAGGGVVAPFPFQGEDLDILAKAVLTRQNPEVCAPVMAELEQRQDRETGDYSPYWAERNYVDDADKVRASVFVVHGLNDWNVRTKNSVQWWEALAAHHVPRKIWLHQGPHTDPFNVRRAEWLSSLHRWFDFWLYGVRNGIMDEPMADVETAPNQWRTSRTWPVPTSVPVPLFLGPATAGDDPRPGTLDRLPTGFGERQSFVDDTTQTAEQLVDAELAADPNRLAYLTTPLAHDVRLSGTPQLTVRAGLDGRSPYLTALLVDYGTDTRFAGLVTVPGQDCVAPGIPEDPGCFNKRAYRTAETPWKIVSRGWLDVRNRYSPAHETPVTAGRTYTLTWRLQPQDHVFRAGHRIGLVLLSTDRDHTLRYRTGTVVSAELGLSNLLLPLSG